VSEVGSIYRNIGLKSEFGGHRSTDMDVQQMLERLLAVKEETKADMRKMMAEMGAMMDATLAETEAIKAETEAIRARTKALLDRRTEANPIAVQ
jgi:hypothetical protein